MSLQTLWIRITNWNILEQSFRRSQSSPSTARGCPPTCSAYLLAQTHINSRKHKTKQAKNVKKRKTVTSQTQFVGHLLWGKFMYIPHDRLQTATGTHICGFVKWFVYVDPIPFCPHPLPILRHQPIGIFQLRFSICFLPFTMASTETAVVTRTDQNTFGALKAMHATFSSFSTISTYYVFTFQFRNTGVTVQGFQEQCAHRVSPSCQRTHWIGRNEHEAASNIAWSFLTNVLQPLFKIKTWQVQTNDTRVCPISISSCILNSWLIISAFTVGKLASHLKPPTRNSVGCTDVTDRKSVV